jgi:hypothetical protein
MNDIPTTIPIGVEHRPESVDMPTAPQSAVPTGTDQLYSSLDLSGSWDVWEVVPCDRCGGTGLMSEHARRFHVAEQQGTEVWSRDGSDL